ncbi:MAG: antibiotic biosynthesis monooxygenase [Bauldia sp.]|nr:antibiotic biosynthesis monooxygenase [Bauldia sp.]
MFVAMNRFRVIRGAEAEFEATWRSRERRLGEMAGFETFHLLKGPAHEEYTLYASHTVWAAEADFAAWTRSEQFRAAHRGAGGSRPLYLGQPHFEGFTSVEGI